MPDVRHSLESKDTDRSGLNERTCWLLFRMSVLNQLTGGKHRYRDSYGRFAADSKSGDNTSLGWNDFMPVSEFLNPQLGYTVDDTAVFSASFHIIKVGRLSAYKKLHNFHGQAWRLHLELCVQEHEGKQMLENRLPAEDEDRQAFGSHSIEPLRSQWQLQCSHCWSAGADLVLDVDGNAVEPKHARI